MYPILLVVVTHNNNGGTYLPTVPVIVSPSAMWSEVDVSRPIYPCIITANYLIDRFLLCFGKWFSWILSLGTCVLSLSRSAFA
jgi:hypothetical protein